MEAIAYYLSCMLLFNIIYGCKALCEGLFFKNEGNDFISTVDWHSWVFYVNLIHFVIICVLILVSIIFTIKIVKNSDLPVNGEKGKTITPLNVENLTADNYFSKFSLLILTGLSLPVNHHVFSFLIYWLIFIAIAIVYIKQDLYYINPVLTLCNFNVYRCVDTNKNKFILVVKGIKIENAKGINYANTSKKLLRLNYSKGKTE